MKYPEFDTNLLATINIEDRGSKVHIDDFAKSPKPGASFIEFAYSLPKLLMSKNIEVAAQSIVEARRNNKPVIFGMGGHVIKVGLSPIICDLIKRNIITCISMNGATAIHDTEIALYGETSEDVNQLLKAGRFGMTSSTASFINNAATWAKYKKQGFGQTVGEKLQNSKYKEFSVLYTAYDKDIPATIHVALGTDVIHSHHSVDGAGIGESSIRDFRILTEHMRDLPNGGVIVNIGSAVVLPEVFLKSISSLRNVLKDEFTNFTGINMDFISGYRSNIQIIERVETLGGRGINLIGAHEINVPLLSQLIIERL